MNQYWLIAFILLLAGVGYFGYKSGENAVEVACQKHDEMQQEHVISQMSTQTQITNGVENAYHTGITAIDNLYATASVQHLPNNTVSAVPAAACGTQTSKRYKLTLKQCDIEEAKANALWNWTQQQSAVK